MTSTVKKALTPNSSEESLTIAISEQQSASASIINHAPAGVALDTGREDITIGCYATTENQQTAAGMEKTLYVPLKDAKASMVEGIWKKATSLQPPSDDNQVTLDTTPKFQHQTQSHFNAAVTTITSLGYDHATYVPLHIYGGPGGHAM